MINCSLEKYIFEVVSINFRLYKHNATQFDSVFSAIQKMEFYDLIFIFDDPEAVGYIHQIKMGTLEFFCNLINCSY